MSTGLPARLMHVSFSRHPAKGRTQHGTHAPPRGGGGAGPAFREGRSPQPLGQPAAIHPLGDAQLQSPLSKARPCLAAHVPDGRPGSGVGRPSRPGPKCDVAESSFTCRLSVGSVEAVAGAALQLSLWLHPVRRPSRPQWVLPASGC